ncbi:hypothetical protein [Neisseria elongata]|uniref:hypothetical protein n=1 Tax=Neisseria elongata TaxID=495 RepID=UPI003621AC67
MSGIKLKNDIMADGSRLFLKLPQTCPPSRLMWRIIRFGGLPTAFRPDLVTDETWMDFRYKGWKFSIHNPYGEYWFFAENSECPEDILHRLAEYFTRLSGQNSGG